MSIHKTYTHVLLYSGLFMNKSFELFAFQVPNNEEETEESLAHADHSKNKAEV